MYGNNLESFSINVIPALEVSLISWHQTWGHTFYC